MTDIVAPTSTDQLSADWAAQLATAANEVAAGRLPMAAGKVRVKLTEKVSEFLGKYYRGTARVDFPPGLFAAGPVAVVRANSGYPGIVIECSFTGLSHTGMTVYLARSDTTETVVHWVAVAAESPTDGT